MWNILMILTVRVYEKVNKTSWEARGEVKKEILLKKYLSKEKPSNLF